MVSPCNPFACLIGKKHLLQESTWAGFAEAEQAEQAEQCGLLSYGNKILFSIPAENSSTSSSVLVQSF